MLLVPQNGVCSSDYSPKVVDVYSPSSFLRGHSGHVAVRSPRTQPADQEGSSEPCGFLEQPLPPSLLESSPESLTLSWQRAKLVGVREDLDAGALNDKLLYQLEYQKLQASSDDGAAGASCRHDAWQRINLQATTLLLDKLEGGTTYAFRLRVQLPSGGASAQRARLQGHTALCAATMRLESAGNARCGSAQAGPDAAAPLAAHDVPPSAPSAIVSFRTPAKPPGAPHPPALLSRRADSLTLRWASPVDAGGEAVSGYVLMCRAPVTSGSVGSSQSLDDLEGAEWAQVHAGPDTELTIPGLRPAQKYEFKVQAINSVGAGPWSAAVAHSTSSAEPGTTTLTCTGCTMSSVSLQWADAPSHGAPISSYRLDYSREEGGPFKRVNAGKSTQCTVSDLQSGRRYWFRIQAENQRGLGPWSPLQAFSAGSAPPSPPQFVRVQEVDRSSATVLWKPPVQPAGAPPRTLTYRVDLQARSSYAKAHFGLTGVDDWLEVYRDAGEGCVLSDLQPGCHYAVRVQAVSEAGRGIWCNPVDIYTLPGTPMACGKLALAHAEASSVTVRWTAPRHNGGSQILQYDLDAAPNDPGAPSPSSQPSPHPSAPLRHPVPYPWNTWTVDAADAVDRRGASCRHTITELQPGCSYVVRVRARNREGNSPWSELLEVATASCAPAAPEPPTLLAATYSSLRVSWAAPPCNGSPLTGFAVSYRPCHAVHTSSPASRSSGAASVLSMATRDGPGSCASPSTGHASPCQGDRADGARPARGVTACTSSSDLHDDASGGSVGVGMAAVLDCLAASHRKHWRVQHWPPTATEALLSDLAPHTTYAVRLAAENALGASAPSAAAHLSTTAARPSAVDGLSASDVGSAHVRLEWHAVGEDNGSPITGYQLDYACAASRAGDKAGAPHKAWTRAFDGHAGACRVHGLAPGRQYLFRVRACNARGSGPWSTPLAAATAAAPPGECGALVVHQRSATRVRVKWGPCTRENGAPVTAYVLEIAEGGGSDFEPAYRGLELVYRVVGLVPGREYRFRVCAESACGQGPWSDVVAAATTLLPPSPPADVAAAALAGDASLDLRVTWRPPPATPHEAQAATYEVDATAARAPRLSATAKAPADAALLAGACHDACYAVRVRCIGANGSGHGDWSAVAHVKTPPAPPRAAAAAAAAAVAEPARGRGGAAEASSPPPSRRSLSAASSPPAAHAAASTGPTARAPPKARWCRVRRRRLWRAAAMALALCALALLLYVAVADSHGEEPAAPLPV